MTLSIGVTVQLRRRRRSINIELTKAGQGRMCGSLIVSLCTAAVMGSRGGCGLSKRQSCCARRHDKRDSCIYHLGNTRKE